MNKLNIIAASIGFSLGFSVMFFIISLPVISISMVQQIKSVVNFVGGLILIILGLSLLNILNIPILGRYFKFFEFRSRGEGSKGFWALVSSSFLVGLSFSSGWAPCVGPVLLGILALLSNQQSILSAIFMLGFMALGLMSSFLALSLLVIVFGNMIASKVVKISKLLEKVMGLVFVLIGILILFSKINILLSLSIGSDLLEKFNYQISNFSLTAIVVSYIAGVFLFISPCTLPMVIPYLLYLTGIGISSRSN